MSENRGVNIGRRSNITESVSLRLKPESEHNKSQFIIIIIIIIYPRNV